MIETKNINRSTAHILHAKNLSVTESRRKILSLFLTHSDALAHGDIEKKAGEKFDRVTIYRTLQTFMEKGIIHNIPTTDNTVRYALCKNCTEEHHHDDHVHFVCTGCHATICLDTVVSPQIILPAGYLQHNAQVLINGLCKNCNSTN